jgi:hypothetical protein
MGQAKNRGSFEERKAAAIKRDHEKFITRLEELDRIEAAKTPEEKAADRKRRLNAAQAVGMMSAMSPEYFRLFKMRGHHRF